MEKAIMNIKQKVENNIVFWTLTMLFAGFLAGIGAYKGVLEIAKLKVISESELSDLRQSSLTRLSSSQRKALSRLVADRFEWILQESEGKSVNRSDSGSDEYNEMQYRRLRRSVFFNLRYFQADETILKEALESLNRRGHSFDSVHITRIVAELPRIRAARLRWLEDEAIPALRRDMELLSQRPTQREAEAYVVLPRIAWILNHDQGNEPKVGVRDMSSLEEEVSLLKETI